MNRGMDKQAVIHTCDGIPLSNEKNELLSGIFFLHGMCKLMAEFHTHMKEVIPKQPTLNDSLHMKLKNKQN